MNDLEGNILPGEQRLSWGYVLSKSYKLYAEGFWIYFRIAIIPAVVAYAFTYFERPASRHFLRSGFLPMFSPGWVAVAILITFLQDAVYWTLSTFFFAAIAATFHNLKSADTQAMAAAFKLVRKRWGPLIFIALLTWTLFFLGRALSGFAVFELLERLGLGRNFWALSGGIGLMLVLLAGLLSKFGLAVPELISNPSVSVGVAVRNSLKATAGWELFFMMFLVKSAILAYCINWVADLGLNWKWHHWPLNEAAYFWIQWFVYIAIAAALESPLFIAFSVLYCELKSDQSLLPLCRNGDVSKTQLLPSQ